VAVIYITLNAWYTEQKEKWKGKWLRIKGGERKEQRGRPSRSRNQAKRMTLMK
jgi:hypothetical protein